MDDNYRGAIFDFDGTLIDSMQLWDEIGVLYLESKGMPVPPGLNDALKSLTVEETARYFRVHCGVTDPDEKIYRDINGLAEEHYKDHIPLKPHVRPFLEKLWNRGVKMAIATANDHHLTGLALQRLEIGEFFQGVVTCSDVGVGKEDPAVFLKALELLGTDLEDTLLFEDAFHAIRTAKGAGFRVVGIYDPAFHAEMEEIRSLADHYLLSYEAWAYE
ncbi:HAD family hydrolase [Anaerotalea alkaliphila]|uniref:HAD family phosphatase n=1 Tax=Anaerotalea alkaliphila TaxID=2662126 RepID=A0A7X5HXA7_9FIRM|nr:HAD family phosphatase [Anaerotalea alkaliphila]NDL68318.1 HAD family phosphatase [Anaerotalea alkaliphila]